MYLKEFLDDCTARGLSSQTIATYKSNISYFLKVTGKDPCDINLKDLRSFLGHLRTMEYKVGRQVRVGVALATMNAYYSAIGSFYEFMVWEKYVEVNLVPRFRKRYLRLKRQRNGENTRQLISIEQMIDLLDLCLKEGNVLAWAFIFFAAKTGLRRGELVAMKLQDMNFELAVFHVAPKAKRTNRQGFMDDELVYVMHQYLEWREPRALSDALWITPGGYPLSGNDAYEIVTKYASMLGFHDPRGPLNKKFGVHCLRHFFTTWMRRGGTPREILKELRGDVRGEAIDIYDHIDVKEVGEVYLKKVFKLLRIKPNQSTLVPFTEEKFCSEMME